ncbi:hypothetical protein FC50_GL001226 [Lacticaseibacillus pantheris DSM 15945 = JCM 12539 = NBRC 106106]|uniref:Peptidase S8/S53 domain-containing protein n=2 Tax=Lacticaseibacillus pantheris TaxID=171523 RepID=A0A0R1U2Z2_9LACO|nr:hypothetical protein FC50_GL001226 [Lacticaseibacillus pantheris DSM 15945 = JCM 12539 = NBRC 106106]
MKKNKPHFQISDQDTFERRAKHRLIPKPKENFNYEEHSDNLGREFHAVIASSNKSMFTIPNAETIFKLQLDEGEKIEQRGRYEAIFTDQGLTVRAILGESEAIVSSTESNVRRLARQINDYGKSERERAVWDYVQNISPFSPAEKIDTSLANAASSSKNIDINVIIAGVWDFHNQEQLQMLLDQLKDKFPEQPEIETAELSDDTLSAHMIIPSSALAELANENFVLAIEPNDYFVGEATLVDKAGSLANAKLNDDIDIEKLPTVAIIDDGIKLPGDLQAAVKYVYRLPNQLEEISGEANHGTRVASRCIFGEDLEKQAKLGAFTPKVQVIDVPIMSERNSATDLVKKIRQVVKDLHDECATFLFAYNAEVPFTQKSVSLLGAELDSLIYEYGVNFVTPTGNHKLRNRYQSMSDVISDSGARISAPADGLLITSVGSISQSGDLSTFSRVGTGFNESMKPGLVYPGGNLPLNNENGGEFVQVTDREGFLTRDSGTSFSSPLAAADLAIVQAYCLNTFAKAQLYKDRNRTASFEAKALMYHRGSEADTMPFNSQIGFGETNIERVLSSDNDNATYIRYGTLKRKQVLTVKFLVPKVLESIRKRGVASLRVAVTVVDFPSARRINGKDYLDGYVDTSFHSVNSKGNAQTRNPSAKQGRQKWTNIHHFSEDFNAYQSGDWELTLEYYSRPSIPDDDEIDYVVLISVEDISGNNVDLYSEIEATNRFNIENFIAVNHEGKLYEEDENDE